jgi:hypothetical protein
LESLDRSRQMATNLVGIPSVAANLSSIQAGGPAQPIAAANISPGDTKELVQLVLQLTNADLVRNQNTALYPF